MKIDFKASTIACLAALTLTACGGGGGGSAFDLPATPTTPPTAPTGNSFSLGGTVAKGLIFDGAVVVTDASDQTNELVTGTTDTNTGAYNLTIPDTANFSGPFVRVVVSGGNGAEMLCDAPNGCLTSAGDSVDFGNRFAIDNSVTLSAIVPAPADGGQATVHVNCLTSAPMAQI